MESDARIAEYAAAIFMREIGFADASPTKASGDNGIDVYSADAVAQVKWHAKPVGRPDLQNLVGSSSQIHDGKKLLFFSRKGFSREAVQFADQMPIALFTSVPADGQAFSPVNGYAINLLVDPLGNGVESSDGVLLDVKYNTPTSWIQSTSLNIKSPTVRLRGEDGTFGQPLVRSQKAPERLIEEVHHLELPRALNTWKFHEKSPNDTGWWAALIAGLANDEEPQLVKVLIGPFDRTNARLLVEAFNKLRWHRKFFKQAEVSNYFGHCSFGSGDTEFLGRISAPKADGDRISFGGTLRFSVVV